eukprot:jgi/Botrbrau1/8335/Bobra.0081s0024.2
MPAKTEAELRLEQQIEILRRQKELEARKEKQAAAARAGDGKPVDPTALAMQKAKEALAAQKAAAQKSASKSSVRRLPGGTTVASGPKQEGGSNATNQVQPMPTVKLTAAANPPVEAKRPAAPLKRPTVRRPAQPQQGAEERAGPKREVAGEVEAEGRGEEQHEEKPKRQKIEWKPPVDSQPAPSRQEPPPEAYRWPPGLFKLH